MSGPNVLIDYLPFSHIQALRLAHAIAEAGCRLHLLQKDAGKFSELRRVFGLSIEIGSEGIPRLAGLSIDHTTPEVRVGRIVRPLIFPTAILDYCRARWPGSRPIRVSFPGLPTASRKKAINEWLNNSQLPFRIPEHIGQASHDDFLRLFLRRVLRKLGSAKKPHAYREIYRDGVKLVFSDEGRVFPRKAWNESYYSCLLESEFVLCPDGDDIGGSSWTYRFFESILCGAIPVVEHSCDAYQGFKFRHMGQPLRELIWSQDEAEHNFVLAMKRLTVPLDELRTEIDRLLADPDAAPASVVRLRREREANDPLRSV